MGQWNDPLPRMCELLQDRTQGGDDVGGDGGFDEIAVGTRFVELAVMGLREP